MCGILGCLGPNSDEIGKRLLTEKIKHRGPDSSGTASDKNYYLAHTRLAILDLSSSGNQPMSCSSNEFTIIFNGEIYNHLELRKDYLSEVKFKSSSDTETLLYGLINYGEEFIKNLNGIFAFCFLNNKNGDFLVVRDHFGVKPLYYSKSANLFFSSEIKAFCKEINPLSLNDHAIKKYINFLWSPGEDTCFNEIKKLLPGHYIKGNIHEVEKCYTTKYYELKFNPEYFQNKSENELIDLLEEKLKSAVKRQLLSDVPVGFFLSGGLDSSILVAIARSLNPDKKIICYTIDSLENNYEGFTDDLYYAEKVAEYLNVDLRKVKAESQMMEKLDNIIYHLDEPQADTAPINVYNISKKAKLEGIKVLIGGTGGDDLFSGYRRHIILKYQRFFDFIPVIIRKYIQEKNHFAKKKNPTIRRLSKILQTISFDKDLRLLKLFSWIDEITLDTLFKNNKKQSLYNFFEKIDLNNYQERTDLNRVLNWEIKTFLVDHNLNYTDKMSMAHGVEVRVPFLDKDLVEFSAKLPVNLKLGGNTTKYILKKVAERYLPKDVIYRSKTGFGAPVRKWIEEDKNGIVTRYLSEDILKKRKVFNPVAVNKLIADNKEGKIDASYSILSLIAIESWLKQFFDKKL